MLRCEARKSEDAVERKKMDDGEAGDEGRNPGWARDEAQAAVRLETRRRGILYAASRTPGSAFGRKWARSAPSDRGFAGAQRIGLLPHVHRCSPWVTHVDARKSE